MNPLHIVSFNVASYQTTVKVIKKFYPGGIKEWMDLHKIDILLLQEVKLDLAILTRNRELALQLGTCDFDTFWASPIIPKLIGRNGVATLARPGLTCKASLDLFRNDTELNKQGRAIMTDHDRFVIFNVYVPHVSMAKARKGTNTNSSDESLEADTDPYALFGMKMDFLNGVRNAMEAQRKHGKLVILAGDMNIVWRPQDLFWQWRLVRLDDCKHIAAACSARLKSTGKIHCCTVCDIAAAVSNLFEKLRKMLSFRSSETQTDGDLAATNDYRSYRKVLAEKRKSSNSVVLEKFQVLMRSSPDSEEWVRIGKALESDSSAQFSYCIDGMTSNHGLTIRDEYTLPVCDLFEILEKVFKLSWDTRAQEAFASAYESKCSCVCDLRAEHSLITSASPPCFVKWIWDELLGSDHMVDTFETLWRFEHCRFTCWDQYTNGRYRNEGARIDMFLADKELMDNYIIRGASELAFGAFHANKAATANGVWKEAPFDGSGLQEGTKTEHDTQYYVPHTGMIYTPPPYSDHIAVSLLMKRSILPQPLKLFSDKNTSATQPHKSQPTITSFFKSKPPMIQNSKGPHPAEANDKLFLKSKQSQAVISPQHRDKETQQSQPSCSRVDEVMPKAKKPRIVTSSQPIASSAVAGSTDAIPVDNNANGGQAEAEGIETDNDKLRFSVVPKDNKSSDIEQEQEAKTVSEAGKRLHFQHPAKFAAGKSKAKAKPEARMAKKPNPELEKQRKLMQQFLKR